VDAAVKGAWFAKELAQARKDGRIARVPYDAALPVDTDWDLGMDDSMAIWFSQSLRSGEIRLVDYYEGSGEGFSHYVRTPREKPYVYGKHYPPHDIAVRELGTGKSRKDVAASLGLRFEDPLPALNVMDGIEQARLVLVRCWFDETKCAAGLEALRKYRKTFNTRLQEFTSSAMPPAVGSRRSARAGSPVCSGPTTSSPSGPAPRWPPMSARGSSRLTFISTTAGTNARSAGSSSPACWGTAISIRSASISGWSRKTPSPRPSGSTPTSRICDRRVSARHQNGTKIADPPPS
jgi:hypothetical protein